MYTTQHELNILWKLIRCYINVQSRSIAFAAKGGGDFATLYDSGVQEYVVVTERSASLWSRYRLRETQQ